MIQIHINPEATRVEKVLFICGSEREEDSDLIAWHAIRPLVDKIDRKLKRTVKKVDSSTMKARG